MTRWFNGNKIFMVAIVLKLLEDGGSGDTWTRNFSVGLDESVCCELLSVSLVIYSLDTEFGVSKFLGVLCLKRCGSGLFEVHFGLAESFFFIGSVEDVRISGTI